MGEVRENQKAYHGGREAHAEDTSMERSANTAPKSRFLSRQTTASG